MLSKFSFSFDGKSKTKRDKSVKKELRKTRKSRHTVRKEASQQPLPDLAVVAEVPLPEPRAGQPTKRQFSQWLLQFGDQPIRMLSSAAELCFCRLTVCSALRKRHERQALRLAHRLGKKQDCRQAVGSPGRQVPLQSGLSRYRPLTPAASALALVCVSFCGG